MPHDFGTCLERLRKRRQMHANRLALLAGVDPSYITLLERGRRPPPRDAVLGRLIGALLLTPQEKEELTRAALNQLTLWHIDRIKGQTAARDLAKRILMNDARLSEEDYRVIDSLVQALLRERGAGSEVCGNVASANRTVRQTVMEKTM
ncbi:helix-turn-helix domain-containing protein [Achromobacter kerstersii]